MDISKADWKLYRERVPDWQEHYMGKTYRRICKITNFPRSCVRSFLGIQKWILRMEKMDIQDKKVDIESVHFRKMATLSQ